MNKKRSVSVVRNKLQLPVTYALVFIAAALAITTGCAKSKVVASLEKDTLFSLKLGNFEDQINLFDLASVGEISTAIEMKDGFFYIANGESKKIMETNSYGDLLSLYYNADTNPTPSFMQDKAKTAGSTQKSIVYPFNDISFISVDNRKYLYVVDRMPVERQEVDSDTKQVLSQIVLRFDSDGNFIDYLGRQGPGGTPFPYVKNIYTNDDNELIVICRVKDGFVAYWYATTGYLMYTIPFTDKDVPDPYKDKQDIDAWSKIENIIPDHSGRMLYVKVDYYKSYVDEASKVQSGIDYMQTLLYPLNIEDGSYEKPITIPAYTLQITQGFSTENHEIPYDFLGVTDSGWFFFIISTENGFIVQMVQPNGQKILKRTLSVDHTVNMFYTFSLSDTGILSALFAQKDGASVVWWRTDSLIQAVIKN